MKSPILAMLLAIGFVLFAVACRAAPPDVASRLALYEGEGGASCGDYLESVLAWERRGGDWVDAKGRRFGDQAFAVGPPGPVGTILDTTALVGRWLSEGRRKGAFFLRAQSGTGAASFHSREAASQADRPMLVLEFADGQRALLSPSADARLDCSTYRSLGRTATLFVTEKVNSALEFVLPTQAEGRRLKRARLVLSGAGGGSGNLVLGVYELAVPAFPDAPPLAGLAAAYPADQGIERDRDVIFASGFDELLGRWQSRWAKGGAGEMSVIGEDPARRFQALVGQALRVNLKKGSNYGADLRLNLKEHGGEPEELYFRYYLRLASDWNPTVDGGKLPGLAGTYGRAGWGGRRSDGKNGWSLRGGFARAFPGGHPMHGLTQLLTYAYVADMQSDYGEVWNWPGALFARDRWYCVEQFLRLNRSGFADGELKVWIEGRLAFQRSGIRLRNLDAVRIESVWMNVYHGGTATSPHDQHLYIDNVVLARRYIGPMGK